MGGKEKEVVKEGDLLRIHFTCINQFHPPINPGHCQLFTCSWEIEVQDQLPKDIELEVKEPI